MIPKLLFEQFEFISIPQLLAAYLLEHSILLNVAWNMERDVHEIFQNGAHITP